ncbi:hypothetical protein HUE87_11915 [Candidatus Sulfurimonas marisnigri]|uniref:Nucleoside phosphorylase domain-containing protein n=1 Tax=Candidatus Sulfurimonas marisnigri TaxID=2740405 RepID=A0A7S7RQC9_9BACT|nr:hypothetical protein [Candidatus Sulfurimonas marisnigri]QOY54551.1 hypothetical protein HUE87_11915 [Candidatus Sulfurimonas marisnigri]
MLYIIIALKSEAQAFVDKYKLTKTKLENFTLHVDENMTLIISGIGVLNAKIATTKIIEKFKPNEDDIFLNIGICGANKKHKIGELLEIASVIYKNENFLINENTSHVINCEDSEVDKDNFTIVDMESFGFYEATKEIKNIYMYKVVSDHFEPKQVTKEKAKLLISSVINEIMKKVLS